MPKATAPDGGDVDVTPVTNLEGFLSSSSAKAAPAAPAAPPKTPPDDQPAADEPADDSQPEEPQAAAEPAEEGNGEGDPDNDWFSAIGEVLSEEDATRWKEKYKTPEEYLKGMREMEKLLGQRSDDAARFKALRDAGWEWSDILGALQTTAQSKTPSTSAKPADNLPAWDKRWVQKNDKGEWVPTRYGVQQLGSVEELQKRFNAHQAMVEEFEADPSAFISAHVQGQIQQLAPQLVGHIQQTAEQRLAQERQAVLAWEWTKQNAADLFVDGKVTEDGTPNTPLGKQVKEVLADLDPSIPLLERLEKAKRMAVKLTQTQAAAPRVLPKPTRAPNVPAAPAKKRTEEDYDKLVAEAGSLSNFLARIGP